MEIQITEFENGSSPEIIIDFTENAGVKQNSKFIMYYSLQHFFNNGGGACYIVSVGDYDDDLGSAQARDNLEDGLDALEKVDEVTLILFPEAQGIGTAANYYGLAQQALNQCEKLKDRFTIIDVYSVSQDDLEAINASTADGNAENGIRASLTDDLKYGASYFPNLETTLSYKFKDEDVTITSHNLNKNDGSTDNDPDQLNNKKLNEVQSARNDLYSLIKNAIDQKSVILPPGPAMAGIYARVDDNRGVWKAPANVGINSVIKPVVNLTKDQNDRLNIDTKAGKSINAIRTFSGKGTIVWGARTLAGNDNEWRYISVRRFFNMAEESIKKATERFIFEPNNRNTWVKVKSMIENFLLIQWRNGALVGDIPDHAFQVFVGLGETMTAQDILEGKMIVEVHLAVVRPAEFIVMKFMHKMQES
jgi:phage tail sheath protein FI